MKGACDVKLALATEQLSIIKACEEQPQDTFC